MSTVNPYAPPTARVSDVGDSPSEAETIRREHIKHEASIRSIGILYYLGGGILVLIAVGLIVAFSSRTEATNSVAVLIGAVFYLAVGVFMLFVAHAIRQLKGWARTASTVLAVIGLLGFPVGTLINVYILYLLHSAKGKRIFAPDYPAIVAATPSVKYRTSIVVWIVLGLLVLVIAVALLAALVTR